MSVFDADGVRGIADAAAIAGRRARVHVKIDTGLHRLGALPKTVESLATALRLAEEHVEVVGVFTHFADSGSDPAFTITQHTRFLDAVTVLRPVAADALLHTSGSAAVLAHPAMHHDLVRVGIAFYGYPPVAGPASLRPAMNVFCRVAQVRTVEPGETVGYGRTWRAETPRRIATATMGYGQGLPRALSNIGQLSIRGRRCPIVGVVSMDQVTLDVTDLDGVAVGDVAMFIGDRDGVRIGADEVADLTGTLPHEILCGISEGIPRLPGLTPAALP
jgi:alanine racemase